MNRTKHILFLSLSLLLPVAGFAQGTYNVKEFGASADGTSYDTRAIQAAIDTAAARGGGTVWLPAGKYLTKTLVMKDHIRFYLDEGATLLGSTEMKAFKPEYGSFLDSGGRPFGAALLFAQGANDISVAGNGTIDGQGYKKYYPPQGEIPRPSLIRFIECQNVSVEDITLVNSAAWVQHYIRCKDLVISGIRVNSYANKNNDGLDIESCERVHIRGCNISSEDDAIVLKALTPASCRDIVISGCIISGLKSAIKTGTESVGNFENISITNCVIHGTRGISLLAVDGGSIHNVTISNISMRNTYAVIVLRLGERLRPYSVPEKQRPVSAGTIRNIMISNVQAVNVRESNDFITGIPGHYIENIAFSNLRIEYAGGGTKEVSEREIPEMIKEYPKARMFGTLPACGFYVRHARNILLENISFSYKTPEGRSVVVFDDVKNSEINRLRAASQETAAPFIRLTQSKDILIRNSVPAPAAAVFLKTERCEKIVLTGNALSNAKQKYELSNTKEVIENNNY